MKLSKEEKNELQELAKSANLQNDMQRIARTRHNPFVVNGKGDIDQVLTFLTEYNHFINHNPKPFRKIVDKDIGPYRHYRHRVSIFNTGSEKGSD